MCNAAATATRTYVGTYVPSLCRDRHRAVETMRFSTSLCPSPAATCSRSPKPISSPGIYLLPLSPHPMTTASCPNERSREISPGPSAPFSGRNHHHRIRITYTERGFRAGRSSPTSVFSCWIRARMFARTRLTSGRFQSGGVDEDDEDGGGDHDDGPC